MSNPTPLVDQYHAYLCLQQQIFKAIHNRDERLLVELKAVSHALFTQLEEEREALVGERDSVLSQQFFSGSSLASFVQVVEKARQQVQENETALQAWLSQMTADLQHYRTSQSQHGVLSTYIQQKLADPAETTELEHLAFPPESLPRLPLSTIPSSPWAVPAKESDTVGHQVNRES